MSKYEPLGDFLRAQKLDEIRMTFAEIERAIRTPLPANAPKYPAWWSNNPSNNPMTKVWLDAGFRTEQVSIEGRKLVFRRVQKSGAEKQSPAFVPPSAKEGERHPLFGALKGLMRTAPGVDLTQPVESNLPARISDEGSDVTFPIPIRPNVVVKIQGLPSDLTKREATRIANVILALAEQSEGN